jgi:DNA-binding beta-propeller fold protein YncE
MTQLRTSIFTASLVCVFLGTVADSALAVDVVGDRTWTEASRIQLTPPGNYYGLAFDGSQWHVSSPLNNFWWNLSPTFSPLGTTAVVNERDMRGLDYSTTLNQLVIDDVTNETIRFVNLDGTVQRQFSAGTPVLEGLDFDDRDSTVWVALFSGQVQQWSSAGQLLFSFNGLASLPSLTFGWSGIAIDPTNNHLFLMNDNDDIYEFKMTGQLLGKIISDPFPGTVFFSDNGQGLNYDPVTMILRATSQSGELVAFQAHVPEPCTAAMLSIAALFATSHRRRKKIEQYQDVARSA